MSLAIIYSRAQTGVDAPLVTVEVHLSAGLPGFTIVGLPETAVMESRERVRAALLNAQFEHPLQRITINLAPADLPKEGGRYDLAIALGILVASGQIETQDLDRYEFLGELALTGGLRAVRGALPAVIQALHTGRQPFLPYENAEEGALVTGEPVYGARHLLEVCRHLDGSRPLAPHVCAVPAQTPPCLTDLADIRAQYHAKRALEVAAAGGHNLLMIGPPGTGKTSLASRFPDILPPMTEEEALETAAVASISARGFDLRDWRRRPFRTPHHTSSGIALVGGGGIPRPGEVSLAHNGVLFLDELPEFDRRVLEVLREPLESGKIMISRARQQAEFPARFQLLAAMNPCPCGYHGDRSGRCRCTGDQVARYRARLSGPLLDRIDMHIDVPPPPREALRAPAPVGTVTSAEIRERVARARARQLARDGKAAQGLTLKEIEKSCRLEKAAGVLIEQAMTRLGLSARAYHRVLKVARSIADLDEADEIAASHVSEAIGYRCLDRQPPGR